MRQNTEQTMHRAYSISESRSEKQRPHERASFCLLRGGRMTKSRGEAASYAPNVGHTAFAIARAVGLSALPATLLIGLMVSPAAAADRYWDANQTTPGYGGAGTWNLASSFWSPNADGVSGPYTAWNNATFDTAIFGGTAGTVTLGSPISANGLTFNAGGYTLTGGVLTLGGGTPTITTISGTTVINSVMAGSSGLIKAGGGALTLNGINTFTGGIILNAGTINAGSDAALGSASNDISTAAGTTVALNIAGASTSRAVLIGDGGRLNLAGAGAGSALITGNGQVSVGIGVTMSNDASTYTGRTTFNGVNGVASTYFTSIGNLNEASSLGAPTTAADGTIIFAQSSQYSDNVVYLGDGDSSNRNWDLNGAAAIIRNQGTGTLSITGDVSTNGGSVFSAESADIELLGNLSGGIYNFGGNAGRTITLGDTNTFIGATSIDTVTVRAAVLADAGVASSLGAGTGATTLTNNGALSYIGTGGGTNRQWTITKGSILNDGSGALALTGGVDFDATTNNNGLILRGSFAGINTISGVISGMGALISDGTGTWALSAANTRTGAILVDGGTLRAGNASAFGTTTGVTVNGGTLDLNGFDLTAPALAGTGGTIALGAADLVVNTTQNTSYAGGISGSGNFTKSGTGTLTLSGASSYTGQTSIGGGTLALDFAAGSAPPSNIISGSSSLNMAGGNLSITGAAGEANEQSFNGLNVTAGNNQIGATSGDGGSVTVNFGAITRTGGLVDFALPTDGSFNTSSASLGGWATVNGSDYAKVDAGVITAFTAADYTDKDDAGNWLDGEVISDAGGAADTPYSGTVSGSKQLGGLKYSAAADSTVNIAAGERLGVDGTIIVAPTVGDNDQILAGGSLTGGAGGSVLGILQNGAGNFTIASTIVDNGVGTGLAKGGEGLVTLDGTNTYTGGTTISQGTLAVKDIGNGGEASGIGASAADSSNLVIENGTLSYTGATDTTDRGFTLVNGGGQRTVQVTNGASNLTFTGQVTSPDDAGLTKSGAGTLTLANAGNDYIGATTIDGGTLSVNTLADGGQASGIGASSSDSANLVLGNFGTLQYSGGSVNVDRGFTLGTPAGGIDVSDAGTTLGFSGDVVGDGGLRKSGAGTLLLSGTNTYIGDTIVGAGALQAGSTTAFGTGPMTVDAGAHLNLDNYDNMVGGLNGGGSVDLGSATLTVAGGGLFSGTISGTGGLTRTGNFTLTMAGCNNNYTGATTINGALSTDCLADGGEASGIGASTADPANLVISNGSLLYTGDSVSIDRGFTAGGTSDIYVTEAATTLGFEGQVVGNANLRKRGAGTLVLAGTNTYTGSTQVFEGTLRAGSNAAFGGSGLRMDAAGGIVDLDGFDNSVLYIGQGSSTTPGGITLGGATLTITNGSNQTYSGPISGSGALVKSGAGVQTLSGSTSSYDGPTTISGGVLAVAHLNDGGVDSSIGASSASAGNLTINGGTLRYVGADGSTDRNFTLGASGGNALDASGIGAINFTSNAPLTFSGINTAQTLLLTGTNTGDNTLAAQITNNGTGATSLTKAGTGTWVLTNPNSTYTGVTTISGGVLIVDKLSNGGEASSIGASSLGASNVVIGNGSTLRYTGSGDTTDRLFSLAAGTTFIESSGTGAVVFDNTAAVTLTGTNTARTIALGGTNIDLNTLGGTIGDNGTGKTTLAKNDGGTWVLTGDNTYTGNTVINDGNLIIGNGGTTGNAGAGNVIVFAPTSTLSVNRSDTFNFSGTLSGPGNLAQIGTGTTVLTSAGNSIGATRIDAGTLQVDGGLTTPTIAMNGSSTLTVGGIVEATGGDVAVFAGDAGSSAINVNAGGILRANGNLGAGDDVIRVSGTLDTGAGTRLELGAGNDTLVLADSAVFSGGGVDAGTGGETGSGDILQIDTTAGRTLDGTIVSNFESLDKLGTGTLTLTGAHGYSAGSTIEAGTLQVGNGAVAGSLDGDVTNNGTLAFNLDNDYAFSGTISGTGTVNKLGSGTTTLTGDNTYDGATNVQAGTLLVNGNQSGAVGPTTIAGGAVLGGTGIIGGSVVVANGGAINPGDAGSAPGTLTVNGDLQLNSGSSLNVNFGEAGVIGGPLNDHLVVLGDLDLDGTLNVTETAGGNFGPGIYRVISYDGTLNDGGLDVTSPDYFVQTAIANQVNLVNSAGLALSYWDGDAGPHANGAINGGDGTWQAAGDQNWTDDTGVLSARFANGSFAIFAGAAGIVTVDNTSGQVQAAGMQFGANGYLVQGGDIELVGAPSTIRVGDGSGAGASYIATIDSNLTGTSQLQKADLGTLVLNGANTYNGGTAINGGTLQILADANLGDVSGGLSLDGGTLRNTGIITSGRATSLLTGGGTFETLADLALTGVVSGTGTVTKTGAATLTLAGTNTYLGGTIINDGAVSVSADENLGAASGDLTLDGGTLNNTAAFTSSRSATLDTAGGTFQTDAELSWLGTIDGAGRLTKTGTGALVLNADNGYTGGTTIADGLLQLGNGGTSGFIHGDVVNDGTLAFNRADQITFDSLVSGTGALDQKGTGTVILTAANSYTGQTTVNGGALYINGDQSLATGETIVAGGASLGGMGIIGGNVTLDALATLNPGDLGSTPGMLTIDGSLSLSSDATLAYNFGQAGVVGGAYNDLTVVHGNLDLAGTIDVAEAPGGDFGPGIYRVISYDGTLNDGGLVTTSPDHSVQTAIANQVNLVNTAGLLLNYWDGADGSLHNNDAVNGGDGIWQLGGNPNWTESTGDLNGTFDNGSFAVFAGTAGTVTVDAGAGDISVAGMQFATNGYLVGGDDIELAGPRATIRVGDGTLPGADYVATIVSNLTGAGQLVKTDLGTLVLDGANTYAGGTAINGGTVQISDDGNLGDAAGALAFDSGTLGNTAAIASARGVSLLDGGGTFKTDADLALSGLIEGTGGFVKSGSAALVLTGTNTYSGETTVSAGGLFVNGDQTAAVGTTSVLNGAMLGGKGIIGGNVDIADGGILTPGDADGTPGTLSILGDLSLSNGSVLNYSFGAANEAGGSLNDLTTVGGDLLLDGTINVTATPGGSFGPGVYRVFSYDGALTDKGLSIGTIPATGAFVQTAIANQVNLVTTDGLTLNYWDGEAGPKNNGVIDGGNGLWQTSIGNENWTDSTGTVNAPFSDSSFAIFAGQSGTVTVDNSLGQVAASGMQFATDGYVIDGDAIALTASPTSTIRVGDGTTAGAGFTATIASQLTGATQLVKSDLGTLVLVGANSYTGGTAINGGTLAVSSDGNLGEAAGELSLNDGALRTTASFETARQLNALGKGTILTDAETALTWNGLISGEGTLTKAGAGRLEIASDSSTFAGMTAVKEGVLEVSGSLCGDLSVLSGGRLEGTGTVCDTDNAGTIAPGGSIGTLTVDGDYSGSGGTLEIEAELGDDSSRTDRLVVTGDTSGTTNVDVVNLGGPGAQTENGIKIVDVGGLSEGKFSLRGDYAFNGDQAVIGGAYAYRLYKNGVSTPADGDWYLRSTYLNPHDPEPQPLYSPGVPLYEAYADVLQSFNQLGTLQQRVGNRSWGEGATPQGADMPEAGPVDGKAIWARIEAAHTSVEPEMSTTVSDYDTTVWKLQAGLDGVLYENGAGTLVGGVTVHFGTVSSNVSSVFGDGSIDATGYGFGGTLTWYGDNGFYVDGQAEVTWYDSDIRSAMLGKMLADGNNGFGYAFSVEAGQKIALRRGWSLTPQAQLAYSSVRFDDFTDPYGASVSLGDGDRLIGRLGLSADYETQWTSATGQVSRSHVYGIGNVYYDFLDGSNVDVSGVGFASRDQALWGGIGMGGSLSWDDGHYTVHGEALAKTSLEDFGDSNSIGAKVGFSVKW